MEEKLRISILNQLYRADGKMPDIIFKVMVRSMMRYNVLTDKFEMPVHELAGERDFIRQNPEKAGVIGNTNVNWIVNSGKLIVWMSAA